MRIDTTSNMPIYEQVAGHIRGAIASGVYQPGEPVPSIRVLATQLLIKPNTVKRAYEELERAGLLVTRRGLGMFVAQTRGGGAADSARRKTAQDVKDTFIAGLRLAAAAEMTREQIDQAYRQAWDAVRR